MPATAPARHIALPVPCLLLGVWLAGNACAAAGLEPTPPQPKGPFYPTAFPAERDSDLATIGARTAQGQVLVVRGRILDRAGQPLAGARVEIWQTNAHGRYHHEGDTSAAPRDAGFQGWGETTSGTDGGYRFRTVRPAAYDGRAPHIHFAVTAPGRRTFYTQMYFSGAPENAADSIYAGLTPGGKAMLTVTPEAPPGDERAARFDIILP